ncbi:MAG: thiol:disulfide interchange protein DsbA/DsbL [Panacagrimonas sp.]
MRGPMRALVATLLSLLSLACSAQNAASYEEGKHFKTVKAVAKPTDPKRITVEEFFWYGCQHCFHFEPDIAGWVKKKPADVDFLRVPASLGRPEGIAHQKAYYTAEALGVTEKIHKPLFDAIHEKHQALATQPALAEFFNSQVGVLPDVFNSTFSGFAVDSRVRRADQLGKDYLIFSVPTVVVGGKYQTTAQMAGGTFADMTKVIDFLVEKVRKERKN